MEIIIGRDSATNRMMLTVGGKPYLYGDANVPKTVIAQHCKLEIVNGKFRLRNLDINNFTYVNGMAVELKTLTHGDKIELGKDRHPLSWEAIDTIMVNIQPLEKIWNDFSAENIRIRTHQKNIGLLASIPMGFSMLGGLISGIFPEIRTAALVFTAIALLIMCYGFYKRFTDKSYEDIEKLKLEFQKNYTCPHCKRFLGSQPYEILIQNGQCPSCKTKFVH